MDSQNSAAVNQFANWNQTWQAKRSDIDSQICDCLGRAMEPSEDMVDECAMHLRRWFDSQPLDPATRAEFERVKAQPELLRLQVQLRITQLAAAGKIALTPEATD